MASNFDEPVNLQGVILAFEFTPNGTCTSYKNTTLEMGSMICHKIPEIIKPLYVFGIVKGCRYVAFL